MNGKENKFIMRPLITRKSDRGPRSSSANRAFGTDISSIINMNTSRAGVNISFTKEPSKKGTSVSIDKYSSGKRNSVVAG